MRDTEQAATNGSYDDTGSHYRYRFGGRAHQCPSPEKKASQWSNLHRHDGGATERNLHTHSIRSVVSYTYE